jgi:hypothetical protein
VFWRTESSCWASASSALPDTLGPMGHVAMSATIIGLVIGMAPTAGLVDER